jgi:pilus assembly protein CpaE
MTGGGAPTLQVVIIDSDPDHRAALRQLLGGTPAWVIVGEYADAADALLAVAPRRPDALLVEVDDTPGTTAAVERLTRTLPTAGIVAMGPSASAEFVIRVIRAGALEFLRRPVERADLMAALDKVARFRQSPPRPRQGHLTSVFSTRGGLGVTTVASNLAVCLAERGVGDVLLMELDTTGQSDLATVLGIASAYSVIDAFENLDRLDAPFLRGLVTKQESGLSVLPGPYGRERVQLTAAPVRTGLEIIRSCFDHLVLDLRHDPDPPTLAALAMSDTVLFLTALNVAALRSAVTGLAALRAGGVSPERVKVVVVRGDAGDEVAVSQAAATLGLPVFWKTPDDYAAVVSAINRGQPVVTAAPRSKIARNLRELAAALAGAPADSKPAADWMTRAAGLLRFASHPRRSEGGE